MVVIEMKCLIRRDEAGEKDERSDKLMEMEMKNTIKHLTNAKDMLSRKEEYIEQLHMRLKSFEQSAVVLNVLQQSNQERQAENDRLKSINEDLKNSLIEKEREMEAFMKNRDEMVMMYESLVKSQQEEIGKQKKGVLLQLFCK